MLSIVLASALIAAPVLEFPWDCGASHSVTQGNGGQTSHTGLAQYAWDFGMPLGTDVLAAHGGTVIRIRMDSQLGGCSSTYANDPNYVVIDHGDGTAGLYLHVAPFSSNLQVNDVVETGDVIAEVGLTGWTCGPHLHFQVQSICNSWWCQSVPSEFFGEGAILYPESGVSENCGPCTANLGGGQTTISESEVECFDRYTKWWYDGGQGLDGHHWFTYAIASNNPGTRGVWRFDVSVPGDYDVEVHVPNASADTNNARYQIHHAGNVSEVAVNQGAQKGWQALGTFGFDGGGDEYLQLTDSTGEPDASLIPVAFDSVRFTYVQGGDGDGDTGTSTSTSTTGDGDGDPGWGDGDPGDGDPGTDTDCPLGMPGCMCTPGGGCDPGAICVDGYCTPEGSGTDGTDDGTGGGITGPGFDTGFDDRGGGEGCACAADEPGAGELGGLGTVLLGLFGLSLLVRRRD